jgi:uncharacterized protein
MYLTANINIMRIYIFSFIMLFVFIDAGIGQTEKSLTSNPTKLTEYVTDETGTLKPEEIVSLKTKLRKFYDSASTQVLVLMIPSLNGEPIEMVANSIYHANGIGGKGKDNGALIMISKGERKIRIEVGYGLEGVLTDAMSKQIIQKEIGPELKKDNYFKGIDNGVNSIIALTRNEYTTNKREGSGGSTDLVIILLFTIFPVIIIIIVILAVVRAKKGMIAGSNGYGSTYYSSGSTSNNYYSGSSNSSSSSSDSGFSGGGGDSGGGGASGDY